MWTETTRRQYERRGLRYASDLTDAEFALIADALPKPKRLGRPRRTDLREVVNAILYLLRTGCQWRLLPKEFPPRSTVHGYMTAWKRDGVWRRLQYELLIRAREQLGRQAVLSLGIIDSQSAQTTESGGARGFDANKRVRGRKRHILVDSEGLLVCAVVHPANVQDRDGAPILLAALPPALGKLHHIVADAAYAGDKLRTALGRMGHWTVEIIKKDPAQRGFAVLPRRWVVERSFAWFGRNRRLSKDFERSPDAALEYLYIASVKLMVRRLAAA